MAYLPHLKEGTQILQNLNALLQLFLVFFRQAVQRRGEVAFEIKLQGILQQVVHIRARLRAAEGALDGHRNQQAAVFVGKDGLQVAPAGQPRGSSIIVPT